ncbi:MAG TPA: HDIG domain-containing protein [Marinilabiliaceae bacterium]|nr:HDIG domain-containing protein [Marinilabiliaceae bacterium]
MRDTLKKYSKNINRVLIFFAAAVIVVYIFPRQGKFRYEYTQGKPWRHSTLIAPMDFPIYKTPEELKIDREVALRDFKPYFRYDETIQQQTSSQFNDEMVRKSGSLNLKYPFLKERFKSQDYTLLTDLKRKINKHLMTIYQQGIYTIPEELHDTSSSTIIVVVKDNFAEPSELSEFFSYQSAYQQLSSEIFKYLDKNTSTDNQTIDNLISDLEINRYLVPNLIYEAERSSQEKQKLLQNLSLTSGVVLSGQRIIDTGELITPDIRKILDSLKIQYENSLGKSSGHYFILLGQSVIVIMTFTLIFLFLYYFRKDVYNNLLSVLFLLMMVVSMILLARVAHAGAFPIYIIPFAILPIIVRIFFDSRLAFFSHVTTILLAAFFARNSFEFVFIQIPAGLSAMFSLFRMVRRSQLVRAAIIIIFSYSLFYTGLALWQEADISNVNVSFYWQFIINGGLILLVYPLIYVFEKLFGFVSDVTLVELSDTNHPLLRRLAEKAPGTFQHSIQVGNLAQEAVYAIGGNPLLVRAGAMYHDIGKLTTPFFFTENQAGNMNPHENMPFDESAQIVIHHVESGIKMAQKEKLPKQIIDFIATHHGTTKTWFFYNSFINENPDIEVDDSIFTYPGPTPSTKETAVLMMADSVEAASRSLKRYSDNDIEDLVENIINKQISENQFVEAPITFKEISVSKEVFKRRLKNIYHARVEYPKLKKKK